MKKWRATSACAKLQTRKYNHAFIWTETKPSGALYSYHKKYIYNNVEVKARKFIARVGIVPQKDLHWCNHCCIEEQCAAGK
jgi:hypothetical protein